MRGTYAGYDIYRPGGAWFICDVCSQRFRRSAMHTRWDNAKVDIQCLDPRPPQMTAPSVYPEGLPFLDARPPQDRPDRLTDSSALQAVSGGFVVALDGEGFPLGAQSPQSIIQSPDDANLDDDFGQLVGDSTGSAVLSGEGSLDVPPVPGGTVVTNANILADDVTIRTGLVWGN